jgi:predicted membrane-bound mannosyltransferase
MTQLVDGIGVHAIVPKVLFSGTDATMTSVADSWKLIFLSAANVHWGFFSKTLEPVLTIDSGAEVVSVATHHACDDYDKVGIGIFEEL